MLFMKGIKMKKQTDIKAKTNTRFDTSKIAVVDVQAIVSASEQVKTLKEEQAIKTKELNQWLQAAQNEVNTEQDKVRQQALLQKYNAEFDLKRRDIIIQYQEKLKVVSDNITRAVASGAEKKGYSMVIAKNIVIYGGDDITEDIAKIVK